MNLKELLLLEDPVAKLYEMDKQGTLANLDENISGLKMEIPKGYHHKDNLEHSIRVLDNALKLEKDFDIVLRTAALLHDVGKPATRRFEGKKVTFQGHEVVGARIARKMLPKHGYNKSEIREISELIRLHMRSHGFREQGDWSDSAVRRLVNDVSNEKQFNRLISIFYSDVTTKHDHKRRMIHKSVDNLVKEAERIRKKDTRASLRPSINGNEVMEIFELQPGRELGKIMKFLNSDDGIHLDRENAIQTIQEKFIN